MSLRTIRPALTFLPLITLILACSSAPPPVVEEAPLLTLERVMRYEHRLVKPNDLSRINAAFFTVNGVMSIALFILVAMDTVI